jgi:4-amino-4-deoxy-L-arabinose transferase-like glycosyltransferase
MILYPSWLAYSHYLWPEVIHVTLFVSVLWINNYKGYSYKWLLFSGLLLGIAIQFKSLLILFIPFLYLSTFIKNGIKQSMGKVILSIVLAAVTMIPASMKAHEMTGGWMVSNSAMFNLWFGLNDDKRQNFSHDIGGNIYRAYIKSGKTFEQRNKVFKDKSLKKIHDDGYINTLKKQLSKQYFRLFDYQSFFSQHFQGTKQDNYINRYSHNHNELLAKLILVYNTVFYFLIMSAMLLGLMVSLKHSVLAKQMALFLLYVLGLFVLLHTKPRFRIPLIPVMAFNVGFLWHYLKTNQLNINKIINNRKLLLVLSIILTTVTFLIFSAGLLDKYFPI